MSSHSFGRETFLRKGKSFLQVQLILFLFCAISFLFFQQIRNEASKHNEVSFLVIFNKYPLFNKIYHIIDFFSTNIEIIWSSFPCNWSIDLIKYICILFLLAIPDMFQDISLTDDVYVFKCLYPVLTQVFCGWLHLRYFVFIKLTPCEGIHNYTCFSVTALNFLTAVFAMFFSPKHSTC